LTSSGGKRSRGDDGVIDGEIEVGSIVVGVSVTLDDNALVVDLLSIGEGKGVWDEGVEEDSPVIRDVIVGFLTNSDRSDW
jgi:hypothetical protein